jgi:hypothetical protein
MHVLKNRFVKLYHYSGKKNLTTLDPKYYGTSSVNSAEYKYGKNHLIPRVYLYIDDKPEVVVASGAIRYEVLLPSFWPFYNLDEDPLKLYEEVKKECIYTTQHGFRVERKIHEHNFYGYYSLSQNALVCFKPIRLKPPELKTPLAICSFHSFLASKDTEIAKKSNTCSILTP